MGKMSLLVAASGILLLASYGCGGKRTDSPVPGLADPGLPGMQIPFSGTREASALTEYVLNGASADERSAGTVDQGSALVLSAEVGGFEYALYRFNPAGVGSGAPDSVSVLLEDGPTTAAWIGRADYERGVWDFSGPYTKPKTLAVDDPRFISPAGNVWVAVLVPAAHTATVNALSVRAINPDNQPPVVNFTRTPVLGTAPLTVSFDASSSFDPDGTIIEYAWDFEGTGGYSFFTDSPTTTYTYTTGAAYRPKLRVTDDQGAQATQDRSMNVNNPPLAQLSTDTPKVNKGETVFLDALASSDSDGSIVDFEWDLDGDGEFNEAGAEADAQGSALAGVLMADTPGEFLKQVRATDDKGAQSTAELTLTVRGWSILTVVSGGVEEQPYTSLAVINSRPAISYYSEGLRYAYSSAADGGSDWTVLAVDTTPVTGRFSSLAVVNGRPAISYSSQSTGTLKYAYSSMPDGNGGWTAVTLDGPPLYGEYTSLAVVNGRPAISCCEVSAGEVYYNWSASADGSGSWNRQVIDDNGDPTWTSLAVVNGRPAVSYRTNNQLKYSYSSTVDGGGVWTGVTVDAAAPGFIGGNTVLAVVNGGPAISYYHSGDTALKYAYSSLADGSSGWTVLTVDPGGDVGAYPALTVINGKPAISYYDSSNGNLKYASSSSLNGSNGWGAVTLDGPDDVGQSTSLAEVNGRTAINYWDETNFDLKYAVLFE